MICILNAIHYYGQMFSKILEKCVQKSINQILEHFFQLQDWNGKQILKKTKVESELLTDIATLLMAEKGIRRGICHSINKYAKAGNKYMKNYKNKESSYLKYWDKLFMISQKKLPVNDFE